MVFATYFALKPRVLWLFSQINRYVPDFLSYYLCMMHGTELIYSMSLCRVSGLPVGVLT